ARWRFQRVVRFYSHPIALNTKLNFSWRRLLKLCKKLSRFDGELIRWKNVSHQSCDVLRQLPLRLGVGLTVCQLRPGRNLRLRLELVGQESRLERRGTHSRKKVDSHRLGESGFLS